MTREQINTITKVAYARIGMPDHVGFKTITLNTTHLRDGNKIVVGWFTPDTIDDPLEIQPERAE